MAAGGDRGEGRGHGGRGEAHLVMPLVDVQGWRCMPGNASELCCSLCGFVSRGINSRQNLQHHMLTHTGEKPYQCAECSVRFLKKSNLKRHIHRQHLSLNSVHVPRAAARVDSERNIH